VAQGLFGEKVWHLASSGRYFNARAFWAGSFSFPTFGAFLFFSICGRRGWGGGVDLYVRGSTVIIGRLGA
jgi:hypothetical protein